MAILGTRIITRGLPTRRVIVDRRSILDAIKSSSFLERGDNSADESLQCRDSTSKSTLGQRFLQKARVAQTIDNKEAQLMSILN
jgi:hypothetical protein